MIRKILLLSLPVLVLGCSSGSQQDLVDFINETKKRPKGQIEPLPSFIPYQAFNYSASRLRNPFEPPMEIEVEEIVGAGSNVKPDINRPKELLENFNIASLSMVGTFEKRGVLWALVDDGEGQVHYVREGNYLGKNHGRIVEANNSEIKILEIVTDGLDGWVERPRTLTLQEKE